MAVQIVVDVGDFTPVRLKPYDSAWPERFAICRDLIRGALGGCAVRVDHIGSTAVPGLLGRPQLDIQVSVTEPDAEEEYRWALEGLGFALWIREPDRRVFTAAPGALPPHAPRCEVRIYVCRAGAVWEYDQLLLTQYLVADEERRERYAELKRMLARAHSDDCDAYTEAKRPYLRETLRLAQRAYAGFPAI
jgi:GrpB-like predicted nucleotidyltransferase (UPF0157 family)